MAVSPSLCAPQQRPVRQRKDWRSPKSGDQETTGDLATRRGAGDPVRRSEWMTVSRYGHLRSAPVVVDACGCTVWEPPTLRAALWLFTRPTWAPPSWPLASPAVQNIATCCLFWPRTLRVMQSTVRVSEVKGPEQRERCTSPALFLVADNTARHLASNSYRERAVLVIFRCVGDFLEARRYPLLMYSLELRWES